MKKITLFLVLVTIYSCNNLTKDNLNNFSFNGKWTFIQSFDNDSLHYKEIEFSENNTLRIYSAKDIPFGPFKYSINNDSLIFNRHKLFIKKELDKILLKNKLETYILYRIPFEDSNIDKNQFDPFFIREVYFLTNLNQLKTEDAINYLNSIKEFEPVYEDEIIE